jgi:hypothetical protein
MAKAHNERPQGHRQNEGGQPHRQLVSGEKVETTTSANHCVLGKDKFFFLIH